MAIYKVLFEKLYMILTLLMMGLFIWGCSLIGGTKKVPFHKKCLTYPTMMTLDTVIPHPKKIQKIYKSRDTPFEFC